MADGRHFEKPLNRHNSATVGRMAMKFGAMTYFDLLSLSVDKMSIFTNPRW